jgi:peptide/nickel transport system permease protein
LLLANGNWPLVADFYHQLLLLQQSIREAPAGAAQDQQLLFTINRIVSSFGTTVSLQTSLRSLGVRVAKQSGGGKSLIQFKAVERSFTAMQAGVQPWRNWLPVLAWRGTDNQYHVWLKQVVTGDLGISYRTQQPVTTTIAEAFGNTIYITLLSLGLIMSVGIALSNWLSKSSFRNWRTPVLTLLYTIESIPLFVTALLLLTLFASSAYLNIFPAYGVGPEVEAGTPAYLVWLYYFPYLALPVLSLTIVNLPYVTGQIYQAVKQVQQRDYILTAKAKGLSEAKVWWRHVLRNALLPVITLFTGFLPALVSGAVVIEIIYAVPGMGRLLQESVLARDFPVVIGLVLCLGLIKVIAHIVADVLYYLADPRIKLHT